MPSSASSSASAVPPAIADPWDEYFGEEGSQTSDRVVQSLPTSSQQRSQPFTPAFPQEDFQGSISPALPTSWEHFPRVDSPEGISAARTAAAAGLAYFHTGRHRAGLDQALLTESTHSPGSLEEQALHRTPDASNALSFQTPSDAVSHGPPQHQGSLSAQCPPQQNIYITGIPEASGPGSPTRVPTERSQGTPPYSIPFEAPTSPSADDRY